ncbi:TPA: MarR family transcriptional regulator [Klebsiella michiganensis]|nr:MarR family transcriptional regulator [Klebsiella michiganensis]HCU0557022.1 MarR family transcriptional regulator [Klebsiella michiganensis]HCU0675021.1 MarR family transcriptional regulator [Klebsiella michiganensis]
MKPTLLSLLRAGTHSIRDMAKILGISKSRVSWFIAELERRKWVEVTRCAIWFHDGTRSNKPNKYRVKL